MTVYCPESNVPVSECVGCNAEAATFHVGDMARSKYPLLVAPGVCVIVEGRVVAVDRDGSVRLIHSDGSGPAWFAAVDLKRR